MTCKLGRKVAIVGPTNLGPYHLARYNTLVESGVDLTVITTPVQEHFRPWPFEPNSAKFKLCSPYDSRLDSPSAANLAVAFRVLSRLQPDAVVHIGYGSRFIWLFALACRKFGIPSILSLIAAPPRGSKRIWKEAAKRLICRSLFGSVMTPGSLGARYAKELGFPKNLVFTVGNVVDNDHFSNSNSTPPGSKCFAFMGRMAPEKNLGNLLEAYRDFRIRGGNWGLQLAGDGPLKDQLVQAARYLPKIDFHPWLDYKDTPGFLKSSNALILPSIHEPWGLVVNEAMAAGLPVLVSAHCGCCPELVHDHVNGLRFEPQRPQSIADAMSKIANLSQAELSVLGGNSRTIISEFSLGTWSEKFADCIEAVLALRQLR